MIEQQDRHAITDHGRRVAETAWVARAEVSGPTPPPGK
jgi:hypothetical protein